MCVPCRDQGLLSCFCERVVVTRRLILRFLRVEGETGCDVESDFDVNSFDYSFVTVDFVLYCVSSCFQFSHVNFSLFFVYCLMSQSSVLTFIIMSPSWGLSKKMCRIMITF